MPTFKVANVREQEMDLIIVPLDELFQFKTPAEQTKLVQELQTRATAAGLVGTVVPIWLFNHRLHFIAPTDWHPFFSTISWNAVAASINNTIEW